MRAGWGVVLIGLAACGYHPPPQTDVDAKAYRTDLAACEDTATTGVDKQNAKRALTWFASSVRRWGQVADATEMCMAGKGYGGLRWCTADELKSGTRSSGAVVTSSGVQCIDKPTSAHQKPTT